MISLVPLDKIMPNPWQPRQNMGPAGINELALSIARDDLMQVPVARKDPTTAGIYQLAIGHRWLAAFATLETIAGLITDE
jgi:ParB family chromosome partitioning protein